MQENTCARVRDWRPFQHFYVFDFRVYLTYTETAEEHSLVTVEIILAVEIIPMVDFGK